MNMHMHIHTYIHAHPTLMYVRVYIQAYAHIHTSSHTYICKGNQLGDQLLVRLEHVCTRTNLVTEPDTAWQGNRSCIENYAGRPLKGTFGTHYSKPIKPISEKTKEHIVVYMFTCRYTHTHIHTYIHTHVHRSIWYCHH